MVQTKKWYQSKTVWAGVVTILLAGYNAGADVFGWTELPEFLYVVLGAFGVYGRTAAEAKVVVGK